MKSELLPCHDQQVFISEFVNKLIFNFLAIENLVIGESTNIIPICSTHLSVGYSLERGVVVLVDMSPDCGLHGSWFESCLGTKRPLARHQSTFATLHSGSVNGYLVGVT